MCSTLRIISKYLCTYVLIQFFRLFIDDEDDDTDEIVEDPFVSNEDFVPPKKASLKALLNEDPDVLNTLIEDERINDIYFTTIVGVTSGLMVFVIVGVGFLFHRSVVVIYVFYSTLNSQKKFNKSSDFMINFL